MPAISLVVSLEGKYFLRKSFENASQGEEELTSSFCNWTWALSIKKEGKGLSQIVLLENPLYLIVSHFCKKLWMCLVGFFGGWPLNCCFFAKVMRAGWSLKFSLNCQSYNKKCNTGGFQHCIVLENHILLSPTIFASFFLHLASLPLFWVVTLILGLSKQGSGCPGFSYA